MSLMLTNRPRFSIIYQEPGKRGARKKWLIVPTRTDSRLIVQLAIIAAIVRNAILRMVLAGYAAS